MSKIFDAIKRLVSSGDVRISDHGYDELVEDDIRVRDVLSRVNEGRLYWCYNQMLKVVRFTWCGEYPKGTTDRRSW